jgi:hypothetical protein
MPERIGRRSSLKRAIRSRMAFFTDPDGNDLMLHHRYAPYADRQSA